MCAEQKFNRLAWLVSLLYASQYCFVKPSPGNFPQPGNDFQNWTDFPALENFPGSAQFSQVSFCGLSVLKQTCPIVWMCAVQNFNRLAWFASLLYAFENCFTKSSPGKFPSLETFSRTHPGKSNFVLEMAWKVLSSLGLSWKPPSLGNFYPVKPMLTRLTKC
jgi:hypothetical protein